MVQCTALVSKKRIGLKILFGILDFRRSRNEVFYRVDKARHQRQGAAAGGLAARDGTLVTVRHASGLEMAYGNCEPVGKQRVEWFQPEG